MPSTPDDLNGMNLLMSHLIRDGDTTLFAKTQSSLPAYHRRLHPVS